ncbi:Crp/Fnr family transcriptional regulator [Sulfurirhabdus autotrophica]|nr:Crp/Fnr family transcriptional regulator [Sulfurirhabdus autotrophica]
MLVNIDNMTYPTGSVLYQSGETEGVVFTIRQGLVKLVRYLPNGTQRAVRLFGQGDVVGMEALLGQAYQHTAVVIRESKLCKIPLETIQLLKKEHPDLNQQIMLRFQKQLNEADRFITEFSTGTAEARLARLLLFLNSPNHGVSCDVVSREEMGEILGITTETASRIMADFKRRRIIFDVQEFGNNCDLAALRHIADDV